MKKILLIASLLISLAATAQPRMWGTGGYKIRNNAFVFLGTSGTDSVGRIDSLQIRWFKPVRPGIYTTSSAPAAADYPGYIIYNTDSSKLQFSNGSGWANIDQAAGGGGGTTYTFQNSLTESGGFVNLVNDATSPGNLYFYGTNGSGTKGFQQLGASAHLQSGNSFGAAAVIGTNDNNVFNFRTNNSDKMRLQTDGTLSIGTTSDATDLLTVNSGIRIAGTITSSAHSGFSMLTGTSMANFGAIDVTSPFSWALQNTWTNVGATRNLHNFTANITTNTTSTQELRFLNLGGTINNTAGTTTLRGIYWNPTLTSVTGTTHIAFENVTGDIRMGTTSGNVGIGTTPSVKFHVSGTPRFDLGSDATGDIFYRNSSGNFTRLGVGSNGDVLTLASGLPSWAAITTSVQNYEMFYSDNSSTTVGNTTTEATLLGTGSGTAQFTGATAGCVLSLKGNGILSTAASAGIPVLEFTINNYTLAMNLTGLTGSLTNVFYSYEFEIIPVSIGTNQDAIVHCRIHVEDGASGKSYSYSTRVTGSFTSSGTLAVDVTADWDAADPANTLTSYKNIVQIFRK